MLHYRTKNVGPPLINLGFWILWSPTSHQTTEHRDPRFGRTINRNYFLLICDVFHVRKVLDVVIYVTFGPTIISLSFRVK